MHVPPVPRPGVIFRLFHIHVPGFFESLVALRQRQPFSSLHHITCAIVTHVCVCVCMYMCVCSSPHVVWLRVCVCDCTDRADILTGPAAAALLWCARHTETQRHRDTDTDTDTHRHTQTHTHAHRGGEVEKERSRETCLRAAAPATSITSLLTFCLCCSSRRPLICIVVFSVFCVCACVSYTQE